jgi:deoxyhypusine synthase
MRIREFVEHHYLHFNAGSFTAAAKGYVDHLEGGGRMLVTLAGAMSTAELGRSLAQMIREEKVHAICCTAANLEEDLFLLVAHDSYRRIPEWRNLTPQAEKELERNGLNRVTDVCIPESEAFRAIEKPLGELWANADAAGERLFPHQFLYRLLLQVLDRDSFQADPENSWLLAAAERDLPIFVPGWEDSTLGNSFVAHWLAGDLSGPGMVRSGLETMGELADWYVKTTLGRSLHDSEPISDDLSGHQAMDELDAVEAERTVGFFQIGGGIAGDFPICAVPMIRQDLRIPCPYWGYFCQISDSTTSYGSYSGAIPTEKITWGKLDIATPKFVIESDATIVAPLLFAYVLDW